MGRRMSQLETFPNPKPGRDYLIEHTCHEFTSVCPKTGQPDFATLRIRYVADRLCVELKSLKFYLQAFRNRGIFFEAVINEICDELVAVLKPRRLVVEGDFRVRGGISSLVSAGYEAPAKARTRKR
jgi:7-cyano-7-deazaguanine reductase